MPKPMTFDYHTREPGAPQEHDVVTVNGVEFATITYSENIYTATALTGSREGQDLAWKGSRQGALEAALTYALREGLG